MAQIQQLTCLLPQLEDDQIQFVRFPDEWLVKDGQILPALAVLYLGYPQRKDC